MAALPATPATSAANADISERPRFVPGGLRAISLFSTLVWFAARDFFRSPWLLVNLLAVGGLQLLLPADPSRAGFFTLVYLFMLALSALNTMAIFAHANSAQTYAILARPVTRTSYVVACVVASGLVGILAYLLVSVLAYVRYGPPLHALAPEFFNVFSYLVASAAVVVAIGFAVSLMALLAAFVSPFWVRFLVLAVIALLVMSFDPRNFPVPYLQPYVEHIPPLLAPIAGALHFATDSPADSLARVSLVILAAYSSTLLALVLWLSTRREIVLD